MSTYNMKSGIAVLSDLSDVTATSTEVNGLDADGEDGTLISHYDVQLTAAQLKALAATNIELVPTPGAGKAVIPVAVHMYMDYATAVFVQTNATDALAIRYNASTEISELGSEAQMTALITASADAALFVPITAAFVPVANKALHLDNNGAAEYTSATGTGTLSVRTFYRTVLMASFT